MNNINLYAKHYYNLGLNVTCLSDEMTEYNFYCKNRMKAPNHAWVHLINKRQTLKEFQDLNWGIATGVGCMGGYENLRVLDIDGCSSNSLLEETLKILGLPLNYEWVVKSGSKNGYHIYFYSDKFEELNDKEVVSAYRPKNKDAHLFEKIEILWATNIALPPSLHPSGNLYEFANCEFPKKIPQEIELEDLENVLKRFVQKISIQKKARYGDVLVEIEFSPTYNDIDDVNITEESDNLILILDIETDGLIEDEITTIKYPNIVQVAWLIMDINGIIYKKETHLIKDSKTQSNKTIHIHRISEEIIERIGKPKAVVFKKLINDLQLVKNVACHNASFDLPILEYHFNLEGFQELKRNRNIICTMEASIEYCEIYNGTQLKYPKLTELYNKLFDTTLKQLHNAEADALATALCLKKMIQLGLIKIFNEEDDNIEIEDNDLDGNFIAGPSDDLPF